MSSSPTKISSSSNDNNDEDDTTNESDLLLQQAQRLRGEIQEFEQQKESEVRKQEEEIKQMETEQTEKRKLYSSEIPILKSDGKEVLERVDFRPMLQEGKSAFSYIYTYVFVTYFCLW